MSAVEALIQTVRREARAKRARLFRATFVVGARTRILDLGSEDGAGIAAVLAGSGAQPANVYIADLHAARVAEGHRRYGFTPVVIPESGRLPFDERYFDIVHCSSVIEHVTVPKQQVWAALPDDEFARRARQQQEAFADEIRRLGRSYYVQTPNKWFPVESHTWLPFVGYLPRRLRRRVIERTNRYWIKKTFHDWHLLGERDMRRLFPEATLCHERLLGVSKSIMAIKT